MAVHHAACLHQLNTPPPSLSSTASIVCSPSVAFGRRSFLPHSFMHGHAHTAYGADLLPSTCSKSHARLVLFVCPLVHLRSTAPAGCHRQRAEPDKYARPSHYIAIAP